MRLEKYSLIMVMIFAHISTLPHTSAAKHISKITDLAAVTYFTDIDDYYRIMKLQKFGRQPKEPKKQAKRIQLKKILCNNIFRAPFFWMKQEEPLDVDHLPVQLDLFRHHTEIFKAIFVHREDLSWTNSNDLEYDNSYRRYVVHLQGPEITEFVFCCPVWNGDLQTIKQYFVSEEYNMNLIDNKRPIAGRFIFLQENNKRLKIEALAEESATATTLMNPKLAEVYYVKRRKKDGRSKYESCQVYRNTGAPFCGSSHNIREAERADMDPVCKLAPANKLRLCASVFASSVMKNRYHFLPDVLNVIDEECKGRRISFAPDESTSIKLLSKITRGYVDHARVYDEWVFGCKVTLIENTSEGDLFYPLVYYISRGDLKNSIFGYLSEPGNKRNLLVDNYFNNVSVVADLSDGFDIQYEAIESDATSESSFSSAKSYWSRFDDSGTSSQLKIMSSLCEN